MTEPKFTRDGWHVEGRSVCIGDTVYVPAMWCKDKTEEECKANAHLIVAAPEMYEALEEAAREYCGWDECLQQDCPWKRAGRECKAIRWLNILRKARGESEVEE